MLKLFSTFVAAIVIIVAPVFACAATPGGRDITVHVEKDGNTFAVTRS